MTNLSKSTLVDLKQQLEYKIQHLHSHILRTQGRVQTHAEQLDAAEKDLKKLRESLAFSQWDLTHVKAELDLMK